MHRDRMQTNLDVLSFELAHEEMDPIDALDNGEAGRIGPDPDAYDWVP
jgi:2,5-diketo-D-gluconate reductase A